MAEPTDSSVWSARWADIARHLDDLQAHNYEGARSRDDRNAVFIAAFRYCSPIAARVLEDLNQYLLRGTGAISSEEPAADGMDGLVGAWVLSWPEQRRARHKLTGEALEPIRLVASFPAEFLHAHLMAPMPGLPEKVLAWPLQVTCTADAERQEPIFRALAEALLHERIYQAGNNWHLFGGRPATAHVSPTK